MPKIEALVTRKAELADDEMEKFGKKDPEAYPSPVKE